MKKKISNTDKKDWEDFINSNKKLPNKDAPYEKDINKTRKTLDLHGYTLRDANIAVKNLIINSYNNKVDRLIIITGKGKSTRTNFFENGSQVGIIRKSLKSWLYESDMRTKILGIVSSHINHGGEGAFYIYLKKNKDL